MNSMPEPASGGKRKQALYEYKKVYPRKVYGTFRKLKWAAVVVLLAIWHLAPFLRWDRGPGAPDQAILIDMAGRRAYLYNIEIWPQEVYYLTGLLILAAIGLFFVTALLGRVWCGFACWQTVYTDLFVWIEELFEGDRNERMKRDQLPASVGKLLRKVGKNVAWAAVSLLTGLAFALYFQDAFQGVKDVFTGQASKATYGFMILFGGFCWLLAGYAREQVCIYMCPWPRFQAAMFDEDSLVVSYEAWRGEPRGHYKKGTDFSGRGHCVDCRLCVHVCPTGIDIRNGSQLACIGCALCVDACNSVMDRFGLPRGLISYDSVDNMAARSKGLPPKIRLIRGRTVGYVAIMGLVGSIMLYTLLNRSTTEVNVLHERSPLYVTLSDGSIRNGYVFKVLNMVRETRSFELKLAGVEGATFSAIGLPTERDGTRIVLPVEPDAVADFQVFVTARRDALAGKRTDLQFLLTDLATGKTIVHKTMFAGPEQ
ncbi:MAG: cytochrome c oxidase accessory protein CcoG [Alphaproteobacteria bacterium]|nr:cytochrome c oxidase accessory protein CcoG [Alphaproteobacteria bacterium]